MMQHFIITPFSYRAANLMKISGLDPLHPKRLEQHFQLFEISCLPSILNQENQDFTWMLIVDPELPENYRKRLEKLISKKSASHLYTYDESIHFDKLDWLEPWIMPQADYVITSNLDDDDALFRGFTKYISDHYALLEKNKKTPTMFFSGCRDVVFWDFYASKRAALGYHKLRRTDTFPTSAGFSVGCKYPELNFSVKRFDHHTFEYLLRDLSEVDVQPGVSKVRLQMLQKTIRNDAMTSGISWDGVLNDENVHYISISPPQILVINHMDNMQVHRIFMSPNKRIKVDTGSSFPGFDLNFELAKRYIRTNRKDLKILTGLIRNHFLSKKGHLDGKSSLNVFWWKLKHLKKLFSGYIRLR